MTHSWVGIVAAAIGLGIMILVHEWGHFIVARLCHVRVDVFSIGFGNRIFGWKRGNTDYRISVFPLGGYVKMAGDNPSEERTGSPDEFLARSRWQRVLIVLAGPAMNGVLALALMWGLYMAGIPVARYMQEPAQVAGVIPNSLAAQAGLRPGDKIVSINGTKVSTWGDVSSDAGIVPGMPLTLTVERDGAILPIHENVPKDVSDFASVLGYPKAGPVVVDSVQPGFPAAKEGLQVGDEILSADGVNHPNPALIPYMIRSSEGRPVSLTIQRQGKDLDLLITPTYANPDQTSKRWVIGALFAPKDMVRRPLPVGEAAEQSWIYNSSMVKEIGKVFAGLFSGRVSIKELAGPVGIVKISTEAAKNGMADFISFMAFLSLNLGIVNLLPIPIMDGGHVVIFALEGALRRDLSVKMKERFVAVGLVFLLALLAFVTYNDVVLRVLNR
jgi:regulator of sigma E protease